MQSAPPRCPASVRVCASRDQMQLKARMFSFGCWNRQLRSIVYLSLSLYIYMHSWFIYMHVNIYIYTYVHILQHLIVIGLTCSSWKEIQISVMRSPGQPYPEMPLCVLPVSLGQLRSGQGPWVLSLLRRLWNVHLDLRSRFFLYVRACVRVSWLKW